ncbi:MAG: mannose-1-phosphate guanylyltransferase [Candidatus Aminicenantia bacterium]
MANLWAIILAGGYGTRFWPLSRRRTPKQFLPIISEKPMLQETIDRILPVVELERIVVIAPEDLKLMLRKTSSKYKGIKILVEPSSKNTAPSIILGCSYISKKEKDSTVIILPSDHYIGKNEEFIKAINASFKLAQELDSLFTFGIKPTSPETGYGYIQVNREKPHSVEGEKFFEVVRFVEKPTRELAEEYLKSGEYFWNSGMFLWRISIFKDALRRFAPEYYQLYEAIENIDKKDRNSLLKAWENVKPLSIDYALMERASSIITLRAEFEWSDVGSWSSLYQIWGTQQNNNSFRGEVYAIDSSGCLVYSEDSIVSLVGVKDLVIVNIKDALLICHKDQAQKVKELVETLNKKGKVLYL